MKTRWLLLPIAFLIPSLTGPQTTAPADGPDPPSIASHGDQAGPALGTIVVWDNHFSGKPTAHVEGRLMDCYQVFARLSARLDDRGRVTGTATRDGCTTPLEGWWRFQGEEGRFEIEFDLGHHREVEVCAEFEGRHSYWSGGWRVEDD